MRLAARREASPYWRRVPSRVSLVSGVLDDPADKAILFKYLSEMARTTILD